MFDSKAGRLVMQDKIDHRHELGRLRRADARHARHEDPDISLASAGLIRLAEGTVRANALTFYSAKHTLTFRGKVPSTWSGRRRRRSRPRRTPPPQSVRPPAGDGAPASRSASDAGAATGGSSPPMPGARSRRRHDASVASRNWRPSSMPAALLRAS